MAEIIFDGVTKRYPGGHEAVRGLDISVSDGEFLVLVGPSGCGKSTALRMVAGLEDISEGRILIGGEVANELAPRERNIAMVFQSYALYPHLTVAENIGFGLRVRGMAKSEVAAKVKATAEILELDALLARKPAQLSGGQRQRVAMGRAIVRAPRAFLMDEPLSNLDARLRVQMRTEIARIQRVARITTIYVTHDQVEAMTMADRVAVMDRGTLQQIGPPRALYHEPANLFVASFIGSPAIGLVEGCLVSTADEVQLILGSRRLPLPPSMLSCKPVLAQHRDGIVVVGIRSEALRFVPPGADPHVSIPGTVAIAEDLGSSLLVHLDVEAPPPRLESPSARVFAPDEGLPSRQDRGRVCASIDGLRSVRPGDAMEIAVDVERLHFFDPKTGDAIGP